MLFAVCILVGHQARPRFSRLLRQTCFDILQDLFGVCISTTHHIFRPLVRIFSPKEITTTNKPYNPELDCFLTQFFKNLEPYGSCSSHKKYWNFNFPVKASVRNYCTRTHEATCEHSWKDEMLLVLSSKITGVAFGISE